jgi:ABC-type spermidine/putrescine transport system permease subunit II
MRRPSLVAVIAIIVVTLLYAPIVLVIINSFNADELLVAWGGVVR